MTNLSRTNLNNGAAVGPQGEGRESPSTFPTYPAYKDSGVEWLGDVPEHWGVSPLKWLAEQVTDKATTSEFQVGLENIEGWTGRFIETDTEFAGDGIAFRQEDILFGKLRPYLAKVWLADRPGQAVGDFFVLRPRAVNGEFLHKYILTPTVIEDLNASTIGAKMPRVGWEDLAALAVSLPPYKEQTQIARFLNHETARIDALIEEQQRLIELLKEKRQAVISHAVTKGLDPTVPMKDSGVEWLGKVPAHWEVIAIKWLSPVLRGASPRPIDDPKYFDESGEYAWVRIADVSASDGTLRETTQTLSALGASLSVKMEPGEMFLSIAGTVGKPCITQIKACIHDGFVYFPSLSIDNKFLYRIFEVGTCYGGLGKMGTQLNLNTETVGGIQIGVPPSSEIAHILEFIDRQSSAFDSLIEEAAKGVDLLQERRSALISAAVTGKIDVRGWQPPASTQAPESAVAEAD